MKISQLQALVAVADHDNFTEAALSLQLSQSAVSHAIASLEDELGVSLVSRGRHGASLTAVGERVTLHARKVLNLLTQIAHEAALEKGLMGGKIRLAAFRSAATHLLPPVIVRFRSRFANIEITLTEDEYEGVEQVLREGRADIGIVALPAPDDFETWEIARDEYVVLLPGSEIAAPRTLSWEELAAQSFILSGDRQVAAILNHCKAANLALNVAYRVREDSTVVSMVAQGLGAAILPRLAADPLPEGVQAHRLPVPFYRLIGAAIVASALHSPATFAFLDALRETGLFAADSAR